MDWNAQKSFIVPSVWLILVKTRRVDAPLNSTYPRKLYLNKIRVCKKMFLSTLDITNKIIDYAIREKSVSGIQLSAQAMRGKKSPRQQNSTRRH